MRRNIVLPELDGLVIPLPGLLVLFFELIVHADVIVGTVVL